MVLGDVKGSGLVDQRDRRVTACDAAGIDYAFGPLRETAAYRLQRSVAVNRAPVYCALCGKRVGRRGHEHVVCSECNGRAMKCVKSALFDAPCCSGIMADAKAGRRGRYHDVRTSWVRADLMNVRVDVDRGPPSSAGVRRSRNSADVDVDQKHAVACRRNRTNSKRWTHQLAVDYRGARVPLIASLYGIKSGQEVRRSVAGFDTQHPCVVRSGEDGVFDCYAAGKLEFTLCQRGPLPISGSAAEGMPINNREHATAPVTRQPAYLPIRKFLMDRCTDDAEHAVGPGCNQYRRASHQSRSPRTLTQDAPAIAAIHKPHLVNKVKGCVWKW